MCPGACDQVADMGNDRACIFSAADGVFVGHAVTGVPRPSDVVQCEGGWVVACAGTDSLVYVAGVQGVPCVV